MPYIFALSSDDKVYDPTVAEQSLTEHCVLCGNDTGVPKGTPHHPLFVPGVGYVCFQCAGPTAPEREVG